MTVLTVSTWAYIRVLDERDVALNAKADSQSQRDAALQARAETQKERDAAVKARAETLTALRTQLWASASNIRLSDSPNRRVNGMTLLRQSAALKPEPELQGKLRDEAVEFLVIRDVEARPGFATGRARGLAFGADGSRMAALTQNDEGDFFKLFDVAARTKIIERSLRDDNRGQGGSQGGGGGGLGGGGGPGGGRRWMEFGPTMAAAGESIAVVSPDGRGVRLFDASTGARLTDLAMPGRRIISLYAAPDGRRLVTVESTRRGDRDRPRTGQGPPPPPDEIASAATKSALFPFQGMNYVINLWDPKSKTLDKPLKTLVQYDQDGPRDSPQVAISPDGKTVATSRTFKTAVSLWSTETGDLLGSPIETQSELTALAIGPENQLATAGSGEIRLWDLNSRSPIAYLDPKQSAVRFLRYSPSGSFLAVVGGPVGRDIELWDTESHNLVAVLKSDDRVEDVAFSPDGRTLVASGQATTTQAWAVVDPDVRTRLSGFDAVTRSMAFRPDGLLALGSWRGTTRFWNAGHCLNGTPSTNSITTAPIVSTTTTTTTTTPASDRPASLAFDNLGRLITIDQDGLRLSDNPPDSLESANVNVKFPETPKLPFYWAILAPSSSGERMAIARVGQVMLWKSSEPTSVVNVTLPPVPPSSGRVDRGGRGGRDPFGPSVFWRAIAVSSPGDRLYLIDQRGNMVAWGLDGQKARSLGWTGIPSQANALALSPDGQVLAVGHDKGFVTLIDTATGQASGTLSRGDAEGRAEAIAFSPDGQKLAVGTQLGHIDVWSLNNPTTPPLRLPGHRGLVTALAFDPKGHYLASAGLDRTADVWNLERLREEFGKLGLDW